MTLDGGAINLMSIGIWHNIIRYFFQSLIIVLLLALIITLHALPRLCVALRITISFIKACSGSGIDLEKYYQLTIKESASANEDNLPYSNRGNNEFHFVNINFQQFILFKSYSESTSVQSQLTVEKIKNENRNLKTANSYKRIRLMFV